MVCGVWPEQCSTALLLTEEVWTLTMECGNTGALGHTTAGTNSKHIIIDTGSIICMTVAKTASEKSLRAGAPVLCILLHNSITYIYSIHIIPQLWLLGQTFKPGLLVLG